MKTARTLFIALIALACSGNENKTGTAPDAPANTLIFMDKSGSVNVSRAFINQKYQQAIRTIVEQTIHQKGDKIEVYFIHENTAKARALTLTSRSEMDDVSHASATDREAAKTSFDLMLQREKNSFRQQILGELAEQNGNKSNQETDILASIQVISRLAENGAPVNVYYLSDMIESMKGGRDFGKNPPSGRAQADEWARVDADLLKKYPIPGNTTVTMILPFEPTRSVRENNPAVTQYWQALFESLGVASVREEITQ